MTYCEMITESKTWVCPKSGRWKIICVGGGSSGGLRKLTSSENVFKQNAGSTTSFGNILSAAGGKKSYSDLSISSTYTGGEGGYTGIAYGGEGSFYVSGSSAVMITSSINGGNVGQTGIGYGAGGGAAYGNSYNYAYCGRCGELKSIELDLAANQSVACTIGAGGAAIETATAGNSGVIVVRFIQ